MEKIINTKPILFSTEMVQAILEGIKTQTRREVNHGLGKTMNDDDIKVSFTDEGEMAHFTAEGKGTSFMGLKSPYGKIGDILWVRERFCIVDSDMKHKETGMPYAYYAGTDSEGLEVAKEYGFKWRPSMHMPKEAARIFLRVTNIRVERLFEISEKDAIAEGIECKIVENMKEYRAYLVKDSEHVFGKNSYPDTPQCSFLELWEKINGKESVNSNPWVWVIEFERVEKPENFN